MRLARATLSTRIASFATFNTYVTGFVAFPHPKAMAQPHAASLAAGDCTAEGPPKAADYDRHTSFTSQ
jgi:hypothetical protein